MCTFTIVHKYIAISLSKTKQQQQKEAMDLKERVESYVWLWNKVGQKRNIVIQLYSQKLKTKEEKIKEKNEREETWLSH